MKRKKEKTILLQHTPDRDVHISTRASFSKIFGPASAAKIRNLRRFRNDSILIPGLWALPLMRSEAILDYA